MSSNDSINEHLKIAVAMRAVRGALGMTQAGFAEFVGVSKPTVARAETLEVAMRLESYSRMIKRLNDLGVHLDTLTSDSVKIDIDAKALEFLKDRLTNDERRRSDRTHSGIRMIEGQNKKRSLDEA